MTIDELDAALAAQWAAYHAARLERQDDVTNDRRIELCGVIGDCSQKIRSLEWQKRQIRLTNAGLG